MTSNNSELLANITRKAPWLLEEDKNYFPENIPGRAQQILENILDYNLTIITEQGRVFKQYLILRVTNDEVLIDVPFEWDGSTSFHVFFRNKCNILNYFQISGARSDLETITARIPERIYILQKRRHKRSLTPIGTKIFFRNESRMIDSAFVHDISEGGMLVWTGSPKASYKENSIIHEIFISLPTGDQYEETNHSHRVLPYITKGKIVRALADNSSSMSRYGVSFIHENALLYKRFNSLIANLKEELSRRNPAGNSLNPAYGHAKDPTIFRPNC